MGLKDLIITPIYITLFTILAIAIRPYFTNAKTRKYFLPALWVRFAGAIALGSIYQFYYGGGDTFNYYNQASVIYEAFLTEPIVGIKLMLSNGEINSEIFDYASRIYWFRAHSEYFVIKIVALLSLFTFNAYTTISLFFAVFSFCGSWLMFSVLQERYPKITKWLAISSLFIPSCIFWGTGILKDTITLGAAGILFWAIFHIIDRRKFNFIFILLALFSAWLIYSIKIYILITLIPAIFIWWYLLRVRSIKSPLLKIAFVPVLTAIFLISGYFVLNQIASTSDRYNLDSLAEWSYITSYDIRYYTGKDAGSGYSLGDQDGTWATLITLAPAAINVTLFRPFLWEVRNPLMVLSALEALIFAIITLRIFIKKGLLWFLRLNDPLLIFCLVFSLTFAFAVGVSTYNFGSLSRYKIPLLPFFANLIVIASMNIKSSNHETA